MLLFLQNICTVLQAIKTTYFELSNLFNSFASFTLVGFIQVDFAKRKFISGMKHGRKQVLTSKAMMVPRGEVSLIRVLVVESIEYSHSVFL